MGGQHAKTFLKEEPLHIDLHISLSTFAHPTIPTYLTKLVILDLCYLLKRGHPFSHGLGVSMPRAFRKGMACHGNMHTNTHPFSQVSLVDLDIMILMYVLQMHAFEENYLFA